MVCPAGARIGLDLGATEEWVSHDGGSSQTLRVIRVSGLI